MINVFYYGYKSKNLLDASIALKNNAIDESINYNAIDQSNIDKHIKFNDSKINYIYYKWDSLKSKYKILIEALSMINDEDHILLINDAIFLQKGWDHLLISSLENKSILSGYHSVSFRDNYKFFPDIVLENNDSFVETSWIQDNIIFGKKKDVFLILRNTDKLKQYGFDIMSSINAFVDGIKVISIPTNLVQDSMSTFNSHDYYPFSRMHNYNEVIKYVKSKDSIFGELDEETIKQFNNKIGYGINYLSEVPFIENDIEYNLWMKIDAMSEKRFLETITAIE